MQDRATQALVKLWLEPEWEAKFEQNSYGFRPGRSCHDAIGAIYAAINKKRAYVLDADIAGCFDNIDHQALLRKLNASKRMQKNDKVMAKSRGNRWKNPLPHGSRNPTRGSNIPTLSK